MEQPFYHVIPDIDDCIRVFGSERSFRYVCQENLEVWNKEESSSSSSSSGLKVDLDPVEWRFGTREGEEGEEVYFYEPSDEIKSLLDQTMMRLSRAWKK
eukprot:15341151-Ditylum_brightwellii.AAC.1